jgi:hypothetical protein
LWQAFRDFDFTRQISIELFKVVASDWMPLDCLQPDLIFVESIGVDAVDVWAAKVGGIVGPPAEVAVAGDENAEEQEEEHEHPPQSESEGDDDDVGYDDRHIPYDLAAALMNVRAWEDAHGDSDEDSEPGGPGDGQPGLVGGCGDIVAAEPAGSSSDQPPIPAAVLAPIAAAEEIHDSQLPPERPAGRGWAPGPKAGRYPSYNFQNGYIKWRQHDKSLDVHCNLCKKKYDRTTTPSDRRKCRAQGRPLGFFFLFLNFDWRLTESPH